MCPNPLFTFLDRGIYLYGICIGVGLLACVAVLYYYTKRKGMPSYVQDFVFIVAILAVALGFLSAKLFQAFYDFLAGRPFNFLGAGITAMGGFVGGAVAFVLLYFVGGALVFKGKRKGAHIKEFNKILLVAPICITIAHAFGRIGCLMSGCCHGAYLGDEYVVGGIYMKGTTNGYGYYVPTQLYEAIFLFALFAVLSVLYFKDFNITMHVYLIAYGVWRIFIEFLRTDYRGGSGFFSPSQWMSFIFIAGGVALFILYAIIKIPFKVKPYDKTLKRLKKQ